MEEFRVPKRKTSVELVFPAGEVRQVEVFLAEFSGSHEGSERLVDLLNAEGEFFPAFDVATQQISFVNRASVALASITNDAEAELEEQDTIPTEQEVEITMVSGAILKGYVTYVMPADRSRLIDYLTLGGRFFRLHQEHRVALVHKRHVVRVVSL